jgi:hypothetical protein
MPHTLDLGDADLGDARAKAAIAKNATSTILVPA